MSGFIDVIYNRFIKPYAFIITILIAIMVFAWAAKYAFANFFNKPGENKTLNDVANTSESNRVLQIYMFHVDWCPHCKTAMPQWKEFENEYKRKSVNGYRIELSEVNCTDDASPRVSQYTDRFKVDSFPTIKAVMKSKDDGKEVVIDFDAKVTRSNLENFIQSITV